MDHFTRAAQAFGVSALYLCWIMFWCRHYAEAIDRPSRWHNSLGVTLLIAAGPALALVAWVVTQ